MSRETKISQGASFILAIHIDVCKESPLILSNFVLQLQVFSAGPSHAAVITFIHTPTPTQQHSSFFSSLSLFLLNDTTYFSVVCETINRVVIIIAIAGQTSPSSSSISRTISVHSLIAPSPTSPQASVFRCGLSTLNQPGFAFVSVVVEGDE